MNPELSNFSGTIKKIRTIGVVGAGTMGAAITQKFAQEGFIVYLNDRDQQLVDNSIAGIKKVLDEAVERKIFKPEFVSKALSKIRGTANQQDLSVCDLIIEAVYENFDVKFKLFQALEKIVPVTTILATNTSSFSVTELSKAIANPERFIGLHYFYHAAKNRLVEIIPGDATSPETFEAARIFCKKTGKDAIVTKDVYGFAVNRFFVPWLNESVKLLEEGLVTINQIDAVAMKLLGIGMGPFALMNATGVAISLHAQNTLKDFGPSYAVAELLKEQVKSGLNWEVTVDTNEYPSIEIERIITDRLLGSIFFVCTQILNENVCSAVELNRGAKIGLKWKYGPIDLMHRYGEEKVKELIDAYCKLRDEKIPHLLTVDQIRMEFVTLKIQGNKAIITIEKPEDLNVLNETIINQLDEKFTAADQNKSISTIVITGSGKAFVAGADVKFFVNNMKSQHIDKIVSFTTHGHELFNRIDLSRKEVIVVLNGMALGGGMELALCADKIYAYPNTKIAFPETGIGIYPGLGGTQRTVRKIGKGLAKYLVLSGKMLNAEDALKIGLIDGVISSDDFYSFTRNEILLPETVTQVMPESWKNMKHLFEENQYKNILDGTYVNGGMETAEISKLVAVLSAKAPLAMDVAEKLMDQARGTQSELDNLTKVFSTKDALLGLTSLGQNVAYSGE